MFTWKKENNFYMITALIENGRRNMQLKSLYKVPVKWYTCKPISSASVKPWICSVKVLQKFVCSSRSSWISFITHHPDFQFLLVLVQLLSGSHQKQFGFVVLQVIYLGCEKKVLFTVVPSVLESFRFSSSFSSIPIWGRGVGITES